MSDKNPLSALSEQPAPDHAELVALKKIARERTIGEPERDELRIMCRDDMIACAREAIAALSRAPEAVAVKPLKWFPVGTRRVQADPYNWITGYILWLQDNGWKAEGPGGYLPGLHESLEAAKGAAQADYERRIRSALATPPAPKQGDAPAADGWQPSKVRFARAYGLTRSAIRENLPRDLWVIGDTILVWANQGDLCLNGKEFPASPAASQGGANQ